ncbi:MAG: VWA domain-containing protein [Halobacteriovoraceae bacterium]|nr:VWA domain-containing protein [Halobacteriovoraceae bacterium]
MISDVFEKLSTRWAKAKLVFHKYNNREKLPPVAYKETPNSPEVGWLIDENGRVFALHKGRNYISFDGDDLIICKMRNPNTELYATADIKDCNAVINIDDKITDYCHGEKIELMNRFYQLRLITNRTFQTQVFLHSIAILLFAITFLNNTIVAQENSNNDEIIITSDLETKAVGDEDFSITYPIKGVSSLSKEKTLASLLVGVEKLNLNIKKMGPQQTEYVFLIDNSSSCERRKFEKPINNAILKFINKVSPESLISLTVFNKKINGENHFQNIFKGKKASGLKATSKFFSCEEQALSLSINQGIHSMAQTMDALAPQTKRHMIVISSGNAGPVRDLDADRVKDLYRSKNYNVSVFAYTPFLNEDLKRNVIENLRLEDESSILWKNSDDINIIDHIEFYWNFVVEMLLPINFEYGAYPLVINFTNTDKKYSLRTNLMISINPEVKFRKQLWFVSKILAAVLCIILLIYLVYRYYKPLIGQDKKSVLSRKWIGDLFAVKGNFPILIIKHPFYQTQVLTLENRQVLIGGGLKNNFRLAQTPNNQNIKIERRAPLTYELKPSLDTLVLLNGKLLKKETFLKIGDEIKIGHYVFKFLFAGSHS